MGVHEILSSTVQEMGVCELGSWEVHKVGISGNVEFRILGVQEMWRSWFRELRRWQFVSFRDGENVFSEV